MFSDFTPSNPVWQDSFARRFLTLLSQQEIEMLLDRQPLRKQLGMEQYSAPFPRSRAKGLAHISTLEHVNPIQQEKSLRVYPKIRLDLGGISVMLPFSHIKEGQSTK
ncbi:MAG: hypothetical protein ACRC10_07165 [Thermoguttaceae bacterium]